MSRTKPQLAPDPAMRQRPRGIDPEGFVGSLFDEPSTKAERHIETLARVREESGADRGPSSPGLRTAREIVIDELKADLFQFLKERGVGVLIQAVDFTNWLDAGHGHRRPSDVDLRVLGALFLRLIKVGLLTHTGYGPNGGGGGTNYNSTARPIYRINELNAAKTGWFSGAIGPARAEQRGAA